MSLGDAKYFLTFKDEVSGFTIYFIEHKFDVFEHLKMFDSNKKSLRTSMKMLRIDNGRKFE